MNQDVNNNQNNNVISPVNNQYQSVTNNQPVYQQPMYQQPVYNMPNPVKKKSNKLPIFIIIGLLILGIAVFAIFGNGKSDKTRTVMIYMVGSNLESGSGLASVDLESIRYNPNLKVVLIAGGSYKWKNSYINKNETSIFELRENGFVKVKEQPVKNMGATDTFSSFLNYAYDNYKSDEYELIFWNHGGAIDGSEYDELNGEDNLSLIEIRKGLERSPFNGKNKLEIVIFRTCLNSTIEVANIFAPHARYLVASEEVTLGAPYTNVLSFMNNIETSDSAIDVSRKYVESYKNQVMDIKDKYPFGGADSIYSTYAIVNLSKIDKLTTSINDFFSDIDSSRNFNTISRVRANLRQYGEDVPDYDMVDLYNLVYELRDLSPSKADRVLANISETIVYNWATDPASRGLSIYFPYNGRKDSKLYFMGIYSDFNNLIPYKRFINNFYNNQTSDYKRYTYSQNNTSVILNNDGEEKESDFTLELTDEQVGTFAKAKYHVFRDNKDGYFKVVYINGKATLDGNTLKASIRDKQLRVVSKDDPNEGFTLISKEVENTDKYITYETGVTLDSFRGEIVDWKMDNATMTITYDKTTKVIGLTKIVYDNKENLANAAVVDLDEYDNVQFSISSGWKILDDQGNYVGPQTDENGKLIGDGVITGWEDKPGNFEFKLEQFDDGYDYYAVFYITDTHNNVSYSKLVKMN